MQELTSIPPIRVPSGQHTSRPTSRPIYLDLSCVLLLDFINGSFGTRVSDESRFGHHATLNGPVGKGEGLSFDGLDDKAVIAYTTDLDVLAGNNPFTMVFGVKPNSLAPAHNIFSQGDGAGTGFNHLFISNSTYRITFNSTPRNSGTAPVVGNWEFLLIRYTGTNIQLYINNVQKINVVDTVDVGATGDYVIGAKKTQDGNFFDGSMNFVAIFSRAFSEREMTNLHNWWRARL